MTTRRLSPMSSAAPCPRSPRSPWWGSCSPAAAARARPAPSPARPAPTGAPRRPSRPRRSRSPTPTSTSSSDAWKRLLALGARFPSWPKLVARVQQVRQRGHGRRPDARAGALLARLRGRGRRARRARRTAPTRRCSASPRCAIAGGLEGALKKEKDMNALGTHGGFDLFQRQGQACRGRLGDTALVAQLAGRSSRPPSIASPASATSSPTRATSRTRWRRLPSDNIVVGLRAGLGAAEARGARPDERARGHAAGSAAGAVRPDLRAARRHPQPRLLARRDRQGPAHRAHGAPERRRQRPCPRPYYAGSAQPRARQLVVRGLVRRPRRERK